MAERWAQRYEAIQAEGGDRGAAYRDLAIEAYSETLQLLVRGVAAGAPPDPALVAAREIGDGACFRSGPRLAKHAVLPIRGRLDRFPAVAVVSDGVRDGLIDDDRVSGRSLRRFGFVWRRRWNARYVLEELARTHERLCTLLDFTDEEWCLYSSPSGNEEVVDDFRVRVQRGRWLAVFAARGALPSPQVVAPLILAHIAAAGFMVSAARASRGGLGDERYPLTSKFVEWFELSGVHRWAEEEGFEPVRFSVDARLRL